MRNPKYQIFRDNSLLDRFRLINAEGNLVLLSEPYTAKHLAEIGVITCQRYCVNPSNYITRKTYDDKYYFVLKSPKQEIIGTSDTYNTPMERDEMIEVCQRDGVTENIENLNEVIKI